MEGGSQNIAPFLYTDKIVELLDKALDWGIGEFDFWDMTLAELERLLKSKQRRQKNELQEKAFFDYRLAQLIGVSVGRIYDSKCSLPPLKDAYPTIFDREKLQEEKQAQTDELSALRFRQFAHTYNMKYGGDANNE